MRRRDGRFGRLRMAAACPSQCVPLAVSRPNASASPAAARQMSARSEAIEHRAAAIDQQAELARQRVQPLVRRQRIVDRKRDGPDIEGLGGIETGQRRHHDVAHRLGLGIGIEQAERRQFGPAARAGDPRSGREAAGWRGASGRYGRCPGARRDRPVPRAVSRLKAPQRGRTRTIRPSPLAIGRMMPGHQPFTSVTAFIGRPRSSGGAARDRPRCAG